MIMNGSISLASVALLCGVMFSSCVPYDEYGRRIVPNKKQPSGSTVTDPKQQEIDAKRAEMRKKEEQRKKELGITDGSLPETDPSDSGVDALTTPPKNTTPPKSHPVAASVPGKPGYVFSPYNNKVVDVRNIPSGTLVSDPSYPREDKKHFRVP